MSSVLGVCNWTGLQDFQNVHDESCYPENPVILSNIDWRSKYDLSSLRG